MTARAFVEGIKNSLGQPRWVGELRGVFTTRLAQRRLLVTGSFQVPVLFRDGETPIWINLEVSQPGDDWQIDHIGWEYNPRKLRASP